MRRLLRKKKCGQMHKVEKVKVESRDVCVVGVYFLFFDVFPF